MMLLTKARFASVLIGFALAALALAAIDGLLISSGLMPPDYTYGDPDVGIAEPTGTGAPRIIRSQHWRYLTSDSGEIALNERGFRTSGSLHDISARPAAPVIAVIGDSHTYLPYATPLTHAAVLERTLQARGFSNALVLNGGRGARVRVPLPVSDRAGA